MISLVPSHNQKFEEFEKDVIDAGLLSEREQIIAMLATAFALDDNDLVKMAIVKAKQKGLSNEEIGNISGLVIVMLGQKVSKLGQVERPQRTQSNCCR